MADRFDNVVGGYIPIFDDEDEVDKIAGNAVDAPEAYLVYAGTTEVRDENNIDMINSVVEMVVLLFYRVKGAYDRENDRIQDEMLLKNDVLNALYADRSRGGNATELIVDDEAIWGTEAGDMTTEPFKDPYYKMRIPLRCSYQHAATAR